VQDQFIVRLLGAVGSLILALRVPFAADPEPANEAPSLVFENESRLA
jgi:hypothetical protein